MSATEAVLSSSSPVPQPGAADGFAVGLPSLYPDLQTNTQPQPLTDTQPASDSVGSPEESRRALSRKIQASLPPCRGCNNKAKKDCAYTCCRACCRLLGQPCPGHPLNDKEKEVSHTDKAAAGVAKSSLPTLPLPSPPVYVDAELLSIDSSSLIGRPFTGVVVREFKHGYQIQILVDGLILSGYLLRDPCVVHVSSLPPSSSLNAAPTELTVTDQPTIPYVYDLPPQPHHPLLGHTDKHPVIQELSNSLALNQQQRDKHSLSSSTSPTNSKKRSRQRAPDEPKGPRSAYVYFQASMRARLLSTPTDQHAAILQQFDWHRVSEEEKEPYKQLAAADKQRYEREMEEWRKQREQTESITQQYPATHFASQQVQHLRADINTNPSSHYLQSQQPRSYHQHSMPAMHMQQAGVASASQAAQSSAAVPHYCDNYSSSDSSSSDSD